jgi:hypothetical protein
VLLTAGHSRWSGLPFEVLVLAGVFAVTAWTTASMQQVTVTRYWDGDEYYVMAEQMAGGEVPRAAAPYVYRLATPWLVAHLWPTRIVTGFRTINLAAAAVTALLLLVWLRRFVTASWARLVAVTLFIVEWHGPARFVFYYPVYVDPLVFPFLVTGLILIDELQTGGRADGTTVLVTLTALCAVGALCREVMVVIPIALLVAAYASIGRTAAGDAPVQPVWLVLAPLAAAIAALTATRALTQPRLAFSFIDTAIFHLRNKPFYTWMLAWFMTFGPALLLVAYDWRNGLRTLAARPYLGAYAFAFAVLAYIGGHDTERYLFWSMPVIYLLIAQALQSHQRVLGSTYLVAMLILAQAVSARIFWAIPSPSLAVTALSEAPTRAARTYSILNRLVVMDDFHWNLWSNFGSRPFHALLLAIYLAFSAAMIGWLHLRATRLRAMSPI